jgi:hypothetical protein
METLKKLETLFEKGGLEALLPQNLPKDLLDDVCSLLETFDNMTFNEDLRVARDMEELINPKQERPYTNLLRFLLASYMRIDDDKLEDTLVFIDKDKWFLSINIIRALIYHYLFEQIRRTGKLTIEPLPTINNILNKDKRTTKFKYIPSHLFYMTTDEDGEYDFCCGFHDTCYGEDFKMDENFEFIYPQKSNLPWTIWLGLWFRSLPGRIHLFIHRKEILRKETEELQKESE